MLDPIGVLQGMLERLPAENQLVDRVVVDPWLSHVSGAYISCGNAHLKTELTKSWLICTVLRFNEKLKDTNLSGVR